MQGSQSFATLPKHSTALPLMELISDFEVLKPDAVVLQTKAGKLIITITKDNTELSIGIPYNTDAVTEPQGVRPIFGKEFLTPPPKVVKLQQTGVVPGFRPMRHPQGQRGWNEEQRKAARANFKQKINETTAKEIKALLEDPDVMATYSSRNAAHVAIAGVYKISASLVYRIDKGISWKQVETC